MSGYNSINTTVDGIPDNTHYKKMEKNKKRCKSFISILKSLMECVSLLLAAILIHEIVENMATLVKIDEYQEKLENITDTFERNVDIIQLDLNLTRKYLDGNISSFNETVANLTEKISTIENNTNNAFVYVSTSSGTNARGFTMSSTNAVASYKCIVYCVSSSCSLNPTNYKIHCETKFQDMNLEKGGVIDMTLYSYCSGQAMFY